MKRLMVIGAVAAVVVILAGAGLAMATGQQGTATHNGSKVCGKIVSITPSTTDPSQVTIVVQNKKGTTTITADANTKIRVDRQKATVANLKVGEKIHARVVNGVASRVSVCTKAGHKHSPPPAPTAPVPPAAQ